MIPVLLIAEIKVSESENEIKQWVDQYFSEDQSEIKTVVTALQALQEKFGYCSKVGMKQIADHLDMTGANVYSVATFYNQFRFVPPGKHHIKMCMGTACAIKGGQLILDHWERQIGIGVGGVTEDREYSIDRVDCVGCCSLAPVSVIGDEVIAGMSPTKVDGILLQNKIKKEQEQKQQAKEE